MEHFTHDRAPTGRTEVLNGSSTQALGVLAIVLKFYPMHLAVSCVNYECPPELVDSSTYGDAQNGCHPP